jgi:hypothetical protein
MIADPPPLSSVLRRPLPAPPSVSEVTVRLPTAVRPIALAKLPSDLVADPPRSTTGGCIRQTNGRRPGPEGRLDAPVAEAILVVPEVPWADRRIADRHPVRPGSRAEVRRWGATGGPDVAEELVNVSDEGLGVRLSMFVRRGERFDVTLWGPRAEWCGRGMGVVRWCVIGGSGVFVAGLQLGRRLAARSLREMGQLSERGTHLANAHASPFGET